METREYFEKVMQDYNQNRKGRMEGEQDFISLIPCNYNSNKKVNVRAA